MLEQTINIRSFGSGVGVAFKKLSIVFLSCLAFILSACVPTGNQSINTELFKSKEDLQVRASLLKPGMSRKEAFEKIGIDPEQFSKMSTQEVQSSIYGNSVVQGSPEQLESFKQRMMAYEGYSLPYRDIKSKSSLGFGTMKVNKKGYDLRLVLIFEKNRLLRASVDGDRNVNVNDDEYMWGSILKKGIGLAF